MKIDKKKYTKWVRYLILALIALLILKGIGLFVVLIALSIGVSFLINNFPIRNIGVELVTFIGVLAAQKYGPYTALIIALVLITYHMVAGGFIANYILWVIPTYSIVIALTGFFPFIDIIQLGIYASFAINIINSLFTLITGPTYITRYLPYAVTNVIFNVFIFTLLSKPILLLM